MTDTQIISHMVRRNPATGKLRKIHPTPPNQEVSCLQRPVPIKRKRDEDPEYSPRKKGPRAGGKTEERPLEEQENVIKTMTWNSRSLATTSDGTQLKMTWT